MSNRMSSLCSAYGMREMIGNRDNNNIKTYENFSYFLENHGPNGSLKV